MRWLVIGMALAASGCSKGKDAEAQYRIVARGGNADAKCKAANDAAAAYLADKNEASYKRWTQQADGDCALARLGSLER